MGIMNYTYKKVCVTPGLRTQLNYLRLFHLLVPYHHYFYRDNQKSPTLYLKTLYLKHQFYLTPVPK